MQCRVLMERLNVQILLGKKVINLLDPELFFFLVLAHTVYKM